MSEFMFAALLFVAVGIALVILAVSYSKRLNAGKGRQTDSEETSHKEKNGDENYMSIGMCLGLCLGAAIGSAVGEISVGMCIGMCLGLAIGACIKK